MHMFAKLANFIEKYSKVIIALWIVALVCSVPFILKSDEVLEYDLTQMSGLDSESTDGQKLIDTEFSNSVDLSEILVIKYNSADELKQAKALFAEFSNLLHAKYGDDVKAAYYGEYGKVNPAESGISMIAIEAADNISISKETGNIRDVVSEANANVAKTFNSSTLTTYVTGNSAINYDTEISSNKDIAKIDPLSIALIFILLGLFFCALVTAIMPPAVVGMAFGVALTGLYGIGCIMGVFYITKVLILVTMLGAGCDYSLFIISRYRDELKHGADHSTALKTSVQWAGESVFTSGLSVIIGFGALSICSFSMVRSLGIVLALGIVIALVAALTFTPALINLIGEKVFWPANINKYNKIDRGESTGIYATICKLSKKYFAWVAHITRKYAAVIVVVGIVLMAPMVYIFATSDDSADMISIMPDSESIDGLNTIMGEADGGMIMPTYIVLELNDSIVDKAGMIELSPGKKVPYLIWKDGALATTIPTIMKISQELEAKYKYATDDDGNKVNGIVSTISGANSWKILYQKIASEIGTTPTPSMVNHALVKMLPSAVSGPIDMLLSTPIGEGIKLYDVPYSEEVATGTGITVENIIDGILNVSTGIISDNGKYVKMMVITSEKPMSDNTMAFIKDVREDFHGEGGYDDKYDLIFASTYVGGISAIMEDVSNIVMQQFDVIRTVVIIALIVLLFLILGSYLTPIRSMLTIVCSIMTTVGLTHFVFGTMMDVPVLWLVPIVLFVVLLGLGMDYDIFLTTRIRENVLRGMNNHDAIEDAVRQAGPVTSLCSLIMGGTFLTMLLTNSSMLQEFGFALGFGILIEGLLMVGFMVPALMHLMGDWSWKGPKFLNKNRAE
ncbi:MMPL family transporter [Candidatus Methanarcanum hacksteinii]|uniref:MMPL family transporter n=1 Tax=Candidatus Methanarcanum hacksteinii TaxID=2911857 RepID=UPI0037DD9089